MVYAVLNLYLNVFKLHLCGQCSAVHICNFDAFCESFHLRDNYIIIIIITARFSYSFLVVS